jgi:type II secretory pathway pseudopilin PulG
MDPDPRTWNMQTQEQVRAEIEAEARARFQARQEAYRQALQAWRNYPAPTKEDPMAEVRDRDEKLRGGRG